MHCTQCCQFHQLQTETFKQRPNSDFILYLKQDYFTSPPRIVKFSTITLVRLNPEIYDLKLNYYMANYGTYADHSACPSQHVHSSLTGIQKCFQHMETKVTRSMKNKMNYNNLI
jgi:hypothetical protein